MQDPELSADDLRVLSDKTRRDILKKLKNKRYTISELSRILNLSKPTVLHHLRILEDAGYVRKVDEGRKWTYYELTDLGRRLLTWRRVRIIIAVVMLPLAALVVVAYHLAKQRGSIPVGGIHPELLLVYVFALFLFVGSILFVIGLYAYLTYLAVKYRKNAK